MVWLRDFVPGLDEEGEKKLGIPERVRFSLLREDVYKRQGV